MSLLCYPLFLLYKLLNMFRATMCPTSGADDCIVSWPRVGIVPWLQGGCQIRLAGSVSIEEFIAQLCQNWLAGSVSIEEFLAQLCQNRLAGSVSIEEFVAQLCQNRLAGSVSIVSS